MNEKFHTLRSFITLDFFTLIIIIIIIIVSSLTFSFLMNQKGQSQATLIIECTWVSPHIQKTGKVRSICFLANWQIVQCSTAFFPHSSLSQYILICKKENETVITSPHTGKKEKVDKDDKILFVCWTFGQLTDYISSSLPTQPFQSIPLLLALSTFNSLLLPPLSLSLSLLVPFFSFKLINKSNDFCPPPFL